MFQIPRHRDLHAAADVEDRTRIEAQGLFIHQRAIMYPRVPSNAIDDDAATAELFDDLSDTDVEITTYELDLKLMDEVRQSVPEGIHNLCAKLVFHGTVMSMHTTISLFK